MADSCSSLAAEIAALRAEIANIPRVNADSIISQAVAKARSTIEPLIAPGALAATAGAIGLVRTEALDAKALANTANGRASEAAGTAATALSKVLSLLGQIAGILPHILHLSG